MDPIRCPYCVYRDEFKTMIPRRSTSSAKIVATSLPLSCRNTSVNARSANSSKGSANAPLLLAFAAAAAKQGQSDTDTPVEISIGDIGSR